MCEPRDDRITGISEIIVQIHIAEIPPVHGSQCGCSVRSMNRSMNIRSPRFTFTDTNGLRIHDHVLTYKECNNSCCSEINIGNDEPHVQDTITSINERRHSSELVMITLTRGHPQYMGVTGELNIIGAYQPQFLSDLCIVFTFLNMYTSLYKYDAFVF